MIQNLIINLSINSNKSKENKEKEIEEWIAFFANIQQEQSLGNTLVELNINI